MALQIPQSQFEGGSSVRRTLSSGWGNTGIFSGSSLRRVESGEGRASGFSAIVYLPMRSFSPEKLISPTCRSTVTEGDFPGLSGRPESLIHSPFLLLLWHLPCHGKQTGGLTCTLQAVKNALEWKNAKITSSSPGKDDDASTEERSCLHSLIPWIWLFIRSGPVQFSVLVISKLTRQH